MAYAGYLGWARDAIDPKDPALIKKYTTKKPLSPVYNITEEDVRKTKASIAYGKSALPQNYQPTSGYATETPVPGLPRGTYTITAPTYQARTIIPHYTPIQRYAPEPKGTAIVPLPAYVRSAQTFSALEILTLKEERSITFIRVKF